MIAWNSVGQYKYDITLDTGKEIGIMCFSTFIKIIVFVANDGGMRYVVLCVDYCYKRAVKRENIDPRKMCKTISDVFSIFSKYAAVSHFTFQVITVIVGGQTDQISNISITVFYIKSIGGVIPCFIGVKYESLIAGQCDRISIVSTRSKVYF